MGKGIVERFSERLYLRSICLCITVTSVAVGGLHGQQVTAKAPPGTSTGSPAGTPLAPGGPQLANDPAILPEDPSARYPDAVPVPESTARKTVLKSLHQTWKGGRYTLEGDVTIQYGDYQVEADRIEYNDGTGDAEATGHVHIASKNNAEIINASRATLNVHDETGHFYDVHGSVGVRSTARGNVYTTENPFLFTGRMVVKTGPEEYDIYDGTVTSCQLPHPDWQLAAAHFSVRDGQARAKRTTFRLLNVPLFFLPYATHPARPGQRESGFLIPIIGNSSSKGIVTGEQIYLVLGRSAGLTVGAQYFSRRGWEQAATLRWRGNGLNFLNAHYSGLLDRGFYQSTPATNAAGVVTGTTNTYVNQGGEDATVNARKDFDEHTRAAASVEYLSSYVYREAFTNNFNQAVSSDITSYAYGTHDRNGFVTSVEADRYQGLKIVSTGYQIRIFHAPLLRADALEQHVGTTPFVWSGAAEYADLKRTQGIPSAQNGFATNFVSRLDLHPRLALPFAAAGFHFRPEVGFRDTYYQHSRVDTPLPGPAPTEIGASLNRLLAEAEFDMRAPVLERDFDTGPFARFLGRQARHTIEPQLHYRYATGVNAFTRTLRFDVTDVVSNKNELEYGFVQRLFLRPSRQHDCETGEAPDVVSSEVPDTTGEDTPSTCGGARETLRWKLVQRAYFDPTFGGIIVNGRRNVLDTTLDLSGVAFLTDQRATSPVVSQMKISATDHIDVEWDMNYDTHAGKFTQSNTFLNFHRGSYFGGVSHARLNAPGRFNTGTGTGTDTISSGTSDFSQLRLLLGYGTPTKPGLSLAANVGLDLSAVRPQSTPTNIIRGLQTQYATAQFAYNWNCCGFSAEYRKYELGSVRNENAYRFNFTLANIGTAGNLRRTERLF